MWCSEGLDPSLFWRITPLEFSVIMDGRRQAAERADDARIAQAWYGEAFARHKRLPPLDTVLRAGQELEPQTPADMLAVMKAIQAAGGDVNIEVVDEKDL